jgi:hypothetical protein
MEVRGVVWPTRVILGVICLGARKRKENGKEEINIE